MFWHAECPSDKEAADGLRDLAHSIRKLTQDDPFEGST
jgi:hypothetical protein